MTQTRYAAERLVDAPAEVVYHCIADYLHHHRPDGFLPPVFTAFRVDRGGIGAGTVITFAMKMGGRSQSMTAEISEPEPGRMLVETGDPVRTVFTVEAEGRRCRVRFDTTINAGGLQGLLTRLLAGRLLGPIYRDELERLERHAQAHLATWDSPNHGHEPPATPAQVVST